MRNMIINVLLLSILGCNSQENEKKETQEVEKELTSIEPTVKWDVKKEYDESGNLVKYDSIYSYTYSNIKGDSTNVNLDSVMSSFRKYFQETTPFSINNRFSYYPDQDSLFMKDFFRDDYFFDHWKREPVDMEKMIRSMDSSRNEFLKQFYPGLLDSKKIY